MIVMLANPTNPIAGAEVKEVQSAAKALGVQLQVLPGSTKRDIDAVFAGFGQHPPDALFVQTDPFFQSQSDQIVALAARILFLRSIQFDNLSPLEG
jgi:ABC-type uncharacterized transport system substrate-binding protein